VKRRLSTGLALLFSILPTAADATTAPSLAQRVHIDGVLDEYAPDEWVLDASSTLPEPDDDSSWGDDNEITRVALTWDRDFLYLAVEFRARDAQAALLVANRAGGLASLEDAGTFRRAIELPGAAINLIALATFSAQPEVARADDAHPFALVDRARLPAASRGSLDGRGGFEMAVPWSMLAIANPIRLAAAVTGGLGEGAGDAAPDASAELEADRFARAVLDRLLVIDADLDDDGVADAGVAPRASSSVEPHAEPPLARGDAKLALSVDPRAFAPERGETAGVSFRVDELDEVYVSCRVFSIDGSPVRTLFTDALRTRLGGALAPDPRDHWDGRDDRGEVVRGGAYVVVAEWGLARGEKSARATAAVVVAR
jgi:hypothetical protein